MERLLIVEDEKMIRKGIRAIAERSGVFIGEIIEARNGLEAYEYLTSHKVELMFTDIRMPKMDGIQLVKRLKEEQRLPKVIVISGYDDFEYATELMRYGARDYMLKPIEMDKLIAVFCKMEEEIKQEKKQWREQATLREFQLKNLFMQKNQGEQLVADNPILEKQFVEFFIGKPLQMICAPFKLDQLDANCSWEIVEEGQSFLYVIMQEYLETYLTEELKQKIGISEPFCKLSSICDCYEQAKKRREQSFLPQNERGLEEKESVPEERQVINYVQMIGTPKVDCCIEFLKNLLWNTQRGHISRADYFQIMQLVEKQVCEQYEDVICNKRPMYSYSSAAEYMNDLEEHIRKINQTISANYEEYKNQIKMKEAVKYIQENYEKDLSMAEVSNYIGISYSWFSTVFKQYIGMNFVNYLKNIRLEEAKKLLSTTDWKIQDISRKVGYENELHFMKIFKSYCGISPTQYRNVCNVVKECTDTNA